MFVRVTAAIAWQAVAFAVPLGVVGGPRRVVDAAAPQRRVAGGPMTSRALAWRTVTAEPARAALAIAGVAVIGALLFDMLMLSQGLLVSFREMLDTTGYDVRVVATDAFPVQGRHHERVRRSRPTSRVCRKCGTWRSSAATGRSSLVPGRPATEVALINVSAGRRAARAWRIVDGRGSRRAPARRPRGARLSSAAALAAALGLGAGSALPLRVLIAGRGLRRADRHVHRRRHRRVPVRGRRRARAGDDVRRVSARARRRCRPTTADVVLVASRPAVEARGDRRGHRGRGARMCTRSRTSRSWTQFNENGFAYFRQISFVLSTITLGFAFLLVATLLTVSVNQRLGQVAALRALGVPRRRIAATLVWESALLVGAGGLLSLPMGWLLALELDRILRDMPSIPERLHFFVFEPRLALWHLGLLAVTALRRVRVSGVGGDAPADCRHASTRDGLVTPIVEGRGLTRTFPCRPGRSPRCATCRFRWPRPSTSPSPGRRAAASPRCCTCSAASTRRRADRCCSKGATWRR